MAITVTHAKVVTTPDDGTSEVGSDEWNAGHVISGLAAVAESGSASDLGTGTLPDARLSGNVAMNNADLSLNDHTFSRYLVPVTTKTGAYTLAAADNGSLIRYNSASGATFTLPATMPVGYNIMISQPGAGQVTFSAATGATLINRSSFTKTAGQYGAVSLVVVDNTGGSAAVWLLAGDAA